MKKENSKSKFEENPRIRQTGGSFIYKKGGLAHRLK